jgi:predicted small integral membrane protein
MVLACRWTVVAGYMTGAQIVSPPPHARPNAGPILCHDAKSLETSMIAIRAAKAATIAAIALFATLVTFGNLTDYDTNLTFVRHVLSMDTIFPSSRIRYRAITNPTLQELAYAVIIAAEAATALLCWVGAAALARRLHADAGAFNRAKKIAIVGLTLGFLLWHVGFMVIGGEWFGMWESQHWNGVPSAFRFLMTCIAVLIFVTMSDQELDRRGAT